MLCVISENISGFRSKAIKCRNNTIHHRLSSCDFTNLSEELIRHSRVVLSKFLSTFNGVLSHNVCSLNGLSTSCSSKNATRKATNTAKSHTSPSTLPKTFVAVVAVAKATTNKSTLSRTLNHIRRKRKHRVGGVNYL